MKTQIKKFLWFDITPRKELYKEIDDCEKSNKTLSDTIVLLKNQTNEKNIKINNLERTICKLENEIQMLKDYYDDDINDSY